MSQCSAEIVLKQSADRRSVHHASTVVYRGEQCSLGKRQLKQFSRRPAPRRSGFQAGVRMVWLLAPANSTGESQSQTIGRGLHERGRRISSSMLSEMDSLDLIETQAANGFGIGFSVAAPKTRTSPRVRVLKLDDFVPVVVGALWRGKLTGLTEAFLEELRRRAQQLLAEPRAPRRNEQLIE